MAASFEFTNKVAVIAGGTGGLGRALRIELEAKGCVVVTISRIYDSSPTHITADLRSPEAASIVMADVVARYGSVDIVINAMGVVAFGPINTAAVDTVEELFLTNTFGHIFLMQAALQSMMQGSVLVGISGVIAEQNLPGMSVYGASKAAARSFNEALSREARRSSIRVIDARPPHTETGLASRAIAGAPPKFPSGLDPVHVARRIVQAIADGETDLPSGAFAP
jgi:cyclic-di-GMP-binding biofilm dispersal mediator protein